MSIRNMKLNKTTLIAAMFIASLSAANAEHHAKKAGSTLHNKESVKLSDVPNNVKSVILENNPDFKMLEAEKELKHGNTYFDIEGLDAQGNEIEFDMLLGEDGSWSIAEIQRDLTLEQCPTPVTNLYKQKVEGVEPQRIIESDQGDGVIVYEFYTLEDGKEEKYEIKLAVEFLDKEWKH